MTATDRWQDYVRAERRLDREILHGDYTAQVIAESQARACLSRWLDALYLAADERDDPAGPTAERTAAS